MAAIVLSYISLINCSFFKKQFYKQEISVIHNQAHFEVYGLFLIVLFFFYSLIFDF